MNYILESTAPANNKAAALLSAEAAYNECITAATQLMNRVISTGRWAHALWDLLPHRNQHNPNTEQQPLPEPARLSTGPISPHEGPSTTCINPSLTLVAVPMESHFLAEPTSIEIIREQNPPPPLPSPAEEHTVTVEEMMERLECATRREKPERDDVPQDIKDPDSSTEQDWETYVAELLARRTDSSSPSTATSSANEDLLISPNDSDSAMPYLEPIPLIPSPEGSYASDISYPLSPDNPNSHMYNRFEYSRSQAESQVESLVSRPQTQWGYPIGQEGHLISNGSWPWRIVRKKPDGSIVYVHMDGFPADWTPGRVQRILDDIPYLRRHPELEHRAALLIYDSLARWANIPSVLVKPEQREFRFNVPYRINIDESPTNAGRWDELKNEVSSDDIVKATMILIQNQVREPHWERFTDVVIDDIAELHEMEKLAYDIDAYLDRNCEDPGALAACNLLDYWVVRRTDKQVLILDFPSKALDGLVYSLTSPQPSRRLYALYHLNRNLPEDRHWRGHLKDIIIYKNYLKDAGLQDKAGIRWLCKRFEFTVEDNLAGGEGGNVTDA